MHRYWAIGDQSEIKAYPDLQYWCLDFVYPHKKGISFFKAGIDRTAMRFSSCSIIFRMISESFHTKISSKLQQNNSKWGHQCMTCLFGLTEESKTTCRFILNLWCCPRELTMALLAQCSFWPGLSDCLSLIPLLCHQHTAWCPTPSRGFLLKRLLIGTFDKGDKIQVFNQWSFI